MEKSHPIVSAHLVQVHVKWRIIFLAKRKLWTVMNEQAIYLLNINEKIQTNIYQRELDYRLDDIKHLIFGGLSLQIIGELEKIFFYMNTNTMQEKNNKFHYQEYNLKIGLVQVDMSSVHKETT